MGMGDFTDPGGMTGGLLAGGALANMAVGRIVIDTASIAASRTVVVREAKLMGDELRRVGDRTDQGVTQATGALRRLETSIERAQGRASLFVAALVTGGVAAAQSVKGLELRMTALSGSEQQAAEHMETLRKQADAAGQPFLSLVEGATGLLPALRGTNADLGQTVMLAQRLAMMDPAQGVAGASFAIREFLNGEYISLPRRLELDRSRLREILAEADGDAAKAIEGLSRYIDEIGISERQLTEMGKEGAYAFQVLRDEGRQTLALVFTPFLNDVLIPITKVFNTILKQARELDPALTMVVGISTGLFGTAAVASRGLPIFGAIPGGGAIAKGAVGGGALYAGSQLGLGAARLAGNLGVPGFGAFEGTSQAEAQATIVNTVKQIGVILLSGFSSIANLVISAGLTLSNAFNVVVSAVKIGGAVLGNGLADVVETLANGGKALAGVFADILENFETIDFNFGTIDLGERDLGFLGKIDYGELDLNFGSVETGIRGTVDALRSYENSATTFDDALRTSDSTMQDLIDTVNRGVELTEEQEQVYQRASDRLDGLVIEFGRWTGAIDEGTRQLSAFESQFFRTMVEGLQKAVGAIKPAQPYIKVTDELLDEWATFQGDLADIDRQEKEDLREEDRRYRADTLKETAQYNEDIAKQTERYNEQVAGVERDYAQSRARALEDNQRRTAEIGADLAARTTEQEIAHRERTAELIDQYNSRREDMEADYQERMAQIQRSARRDMLNAAMRLDASGVFAAQQRLKDQQTDEQRAYQRRLSDLDKWLSEAQEKENEAHAKSIEEAQRNAEKQLDDLRVRYEREEQLAKENQQARLAELRQQYNREQSETRDQFNREMAQLRTQHLLRMNEIARNAHEERQAVETAFISTFNQLQAEAGAHQSAMINIQQAGQAQMEADLRNWWERMRGVVSTSTQAPIVSSPNTYVPPGGRYINPYQTGGAVVKTGIGRVEAGEYILRPDVARAVDRMLGGNMTQGALLSSLSGRASRGDVQINGFTVPITIETNTSARDAARYAGQEVERKVYEVLAELIS